MDWNNVCDNKYLRNLPFKIELNKWGQVVMSPAKIKHSFYQGLIAELLNSFLKTGFAFPECAIDTNDNTKVADVVWCSEERLKIIENQTSASISPEICVEIISSSNTSEEMETKKKLYFEVQAQEFWLCDQEGNITFYNPEGELEQSQLVPQFPKKITQRFIS